MDKTESVLSTTGFKCPSAFVVLVGTSFSWKVWPLPRKLLDVLCTTAFPKNSLKTLGVFRHPVRRGDARLGGGFLLLAVNHRGPRERPKSIQFLLEVHIQCPSHRYVTTGYGVHSRGCTSALQASRKMVLGDGLPLLLGEVRQLQAERKIVLPLTKQHFFLTWKGLGLSGLSHWCSYEVWKELLGESASQLLALEAPRRSHIKIKGISLLH